MAMAQTAFRTRPTYYRHSTAEARRTQRAEMPLFQAFLRPSPSKVTDGLCIKDATTIDAACGSGAFLVKAMCNMMKEAGGINTKKAGEIKSKQLYGIEFDREIFALACANMLIHKDGKTNLEQLDTRTPEACEWIKSKMITKVLMNPPFERKYGCITIVDNVLKSVPEHTE